MVRAKMRCIEKRDVTSAYGEFKGKTDEVVRLHPVSGPGNEEWSKFTPSGEVQMTINNPAAMDQFVIGKDYFVDFTPAE